MKKINYPKPESEPRDDWTATKHCRRATLVTQIAAGEKKTYANLEGPVCIRHILDHHVAER